MKYQLAQALHNPAIAPSVGGQQNTEGTTALAITMGNLYQALVMVGGLALLLYLAWGGINWLTAGGDTDKVDKAKNQITNAIIGMAILVAIIAIAGFLGKSVFTFDILNPTVPEPPGSSGT